MLERIDPITLDVSPQDEPRQFDSGFGERELRRQVLWDFLEDMEMRNYEVVQCDHEEACKHLTKEQMESTSNNGGMGREYANFIIVKDHGHVASYANDAMEPEDATFTRDLWWIKIMVEAAYAAGRGDGQGKLSVR